MRNILFFFVILAVQGCKTLKQHSSDWMNHPVITEFQKKCPEGIDLYSNLRINFGLSDTLLRSMVRKLVPNLESRTTDYKSCCLVGMTQDEIYFLFGSPKNVVSNNALYINATWSVTYDQGISGQMGNEKPLNYSQHISFVFDSSTKRVLKVVYWEWTPWWDESPNGKNQGKKGLPDFGK